MTDMDKMMIDPWKSDDKCERCGELMDYRPGESFTASTDGKVWHYGCAPGRTAYNPDDRLREALEALAGIKADDGDDFSTYPPEAIIRCEITAGEIHKARAVLAALSSLPQGDG